ncbi:MAG: hypothetical protein KGL40_00030 [Rhodocyclaceae bacterium]|nr:hypothetical protein [Rhodocyclaceae bacterium]
MRTWLFAALLLAPALPAGACGHCVEDKVAAVYDHAVLTRAQARGYGTVFFAIEGSLTPDAARAVEGAARAAPGVDKGSVRISVEQAALSMAYDPDRTSAEAVGKALAAKLSRQRLKFEALKVVLPSSRPAPVRP